MVALSQVVLHPHVQLYHLLCGHQLSGSVEFQDKASWFQQDLFKCEPWIKLPYIGIRQAKQDVSIPGNVSDHVNIIFF